MTARIAVVGAGLIGRRHALAIESSESASLVALVDPNPQATQVASRHGVPLLSDLQQLLDSKSADGVILATPNHLHVPQALSCLHAHIPVLVEKPLATDVAGAESIVRESQRLSVPVLTGHHRRHNPLIARAKAVIDAGELGQITTVQATTWFYKPDDYFDVQWRREPGAGPVFINLIHDIDMLRYLCGEIEQIQAMESSMIRSSEVEDTAVMVLRFASGALCTINVSDTVVAPWSWELTARENPAYPATTQACYLIGGTHASLSLPNLSIWQHASSRSWWEPISEGKLTFGFDDPLVCQIEQFVRVIRGVEPPLVSAKDGLANQYVIEAMKRSASSKSVVSLDSEYR